MAKEQNSIKNQHTSTTYDHVLKYTGVFGGVQGLKILINIVRTKLTSIFLGSYGMGLNVIFQKVAEIMNATTSCGLSLSSLRSLSEIFEEGKEDEIREFITVIRTWSFWTALAGFLLTLIMAPVFSYFFFPDGSSHIKELLLVSLFVASMPIEAGECAILKGLRKLKRVAIVEMLIAVATFLLTVPFYYWLGVYGVVLSLVSCGWAMAFIHLWFTCQIVPYRIYPASRCIFRQGWPLVKVGIPYVLAAIAGASTSGLVFKTISDVHEIGLFQAGFNLMVTYAGMVFVAIEADFFPRLSAVNHDRLRLNETVNQQIDVCVALMTPLLMLMALFMPRIMNTLYTQEFIAIAPMAVMAVYYMFFKSIVLPIAYTPLAKGDSHIYLILELIYDGVYLLLMYAGYHVGSQMSFMFDGVQCGGLTGTGVALSLASLFDLLLVGGFTYVHYGFRMRRRTLLLIALEMLFLTAVLPSCLISNIRLIKYSVGLTAILASLYLAWRYIGKDTDFAKRVRKKLKR